MGSKGGSQARGCTGTHMVGVGTKDAVKSGQSQGYFDGRANRHFLKTECGLWEREKSGKTLQFVPEPLERPGAISRDRVAVCRAVRGSQSGLRVRPHPGDPGTRPQGRSCSGSGHTGGIFLETAPWPSAKPWTFLGLSFPSGLMARISLTAPRVSTTPACACSEILTPKSHVALSPAAWAPACDGGKQGSFGLTKSGIYSCGLRIRRVNTCRVVPGR